MAEAVEALANIDFDQITIPAVGHSYDVDRYVLQVLEFILSSKFDQNHVHVGYKFDKTVFKNLFCVHICSH